MAESNSQIGEETPTPKRLGLNDAAYRLGLSYHQVQRLLFQKKLDGGRERDGDGQWYVTEDSVEEYMKAQGAA